MHLYITFVINSINKSDENHGGSPMKKTVFLVIVLLVLCNIMVLDNIDIPDNAKSSKIENKENDNENLDNIYSLIENKRIKSLDSEPELKSGEVLDERWRNFDFEQYVTSQTTGGRSTDNPSRATLIIGDTPSEVFTINNDTTYEHNGDIIIMGTGLVEVYGTLNLTGNLLITNLGTFLVDSGEFRIKGDDTHILGNKNGRLIFQNYSLLHYQMTYLHQHCLVLYDNAWIYLNKTHVSHSGSSGTNILYGNSAYSALNCTYSDWKTWYLHGSNFLRLENVYIGGDIVLYDAATMEFVNTLGIMPWLYFGDGAVVDYSFPIDDPLTSVSAYINNSTPGISGIPWSFSATNCFVIAWGINPYPGSNVTIRDSELKMILFRFIGDKEMDIEGIWVNNMSYFDQTFPITDRMLRLINTSVRWWKIDIHDGFRLNASSIRFSEMVVANNSVGRLYNSTCEGQTVHLGAQDDAFVDFAAGEVWSYTSVWANATMILRDSLVDYRKGEYTYQTRNLAHGNSRLYCLNTTFEYDLTPTESEPEALDSALVMYLQSDFPDTIEPKQSVDFSGSAWIKTGPGSSVSFDRYKINVAPKGSSNWTLINSSVVQVHNGKLGEWNTTGFAGGTYILQIKLWVTNDSPTTDHPTTNYPLEHELELLNYAPTLEPTPNNDQITMYEYSTMNFSVVTNDEYVENLTYTWSLDGEASAEFDQEYYNFITDFNSSGNYKLNLTVTDNGLSPLSAYFEWNITVLDVNRIPIILSHSPMADLILNETESGMIEFSVSAMDPDDDEISFSWYVDSEKVTGENLSSYQFNYNHTSAGTYNVKVKINDSKSEIVQNWYLEIIDINRLPVIISHSPEPTIWADEEDSGLLDFQIVVTDPDSDILFYQWFVDSILMQDQTDTIFQFKFNYTSAGIYDIKVLANDSIDEVSFTWRLIINNTNRETTIESKDPDTLDIQITDSDNITFKITVNDPDTDDVLSYKWYINDIEISGVENNTYTYEPEKGITQTNKIRVEVKDDKGSTAIYEWNVTVEAKDDNKDGDDDSGELDKYTWFIVTIIITIVILLIVLFVWPSRHKEDLKDSQGLMSEAAAEPEDLDENEIEE
jgi:hypothetical protein